MASERKGRYFAEKKISSQKNLKLSLVLLYACLNLETLLSWCFLSLLHLKLENESQKPIVEAVINGKMETLSTKTSRVRRSSSIHNSNYVATFQLVLSGDFETNHGPIREPSSKMGKNLAYTSTQIM